MSSHHKKKKPSSNTAEDHAAAEQLDDGTILTLLARRDPDTGTRTTMDEQLLHTGTIYDHRGRSTRLKHPVHRGALTMPRELIQEYQKEHSSTSHYYELPPIDSILRPSADPSVPTLTVTDIYTVMVPTTVACETTAGSAPPSEIPEASLGQGDVPAPPPVATQTVMLPQTRAKNREFVKGDRIRGGGEDDEDKDVEMKEAEEEKPAMPEPEAQPSSSVPPTGTAVLPPPTILPPPKDIVKPLLNKPPAQWEQHKPTSSTEEDSQQWVDPFPDWFRKDQVSSLEQAVLPEWFNGSATHRTSASYLQARNHILEMSRGLDDKHLTATMVRRSIPGDAGSVLRLFQFLENYHLINKQINDSSPTPIPFQKSAAKQTREEQDQLVQAVLDNTSKESNTVDWDAVSKQVGMPSLDCEKAFVAIPLNEMPEVDAPSTPVAQGSTANYLQQLLDRTDAETIRAVATAAASAAKDGGKSSAAGILGLRAHDARKEAEQQDAAVARIMGEIVDLRLEKLQKRMSMLEDMEALLEAERMSLELERRDLYTARCRHWFGGA